MRCRWLFASLLVLGCVALALAGSTSTNPVDPRISIGGGSDAVPITAPNFTFFTATGFSGTFYSPSASASDQACELGTPTHPTSVPGCNLINETGETIASITVAVPTDMQTELINCDPAPASPNDSPFDHCFLVQDTSGPTVLTTAVVFNSILDEGPTVVDQDDIGLPSCSSESTSAQLAACTFQISLDPWDTNTPLSVTATAAPEPAALWLLLLASLPLFALGARSRRRGRSGN